MGKRSKHSRQRSSTLSAIREDDQSGGSSGNNSYEDMVNELRNALKEKDETILAMQNQVRDREMESLRQEISDLRNARVSVENFNSFSYADVENSMNKFSGKDGYKVTTWVADFEATANVFGWNELQKLVFAKRLLTGTAKLAVRTEDSLNTWEKLKEFLLKEFHTVENSAEVHAELHRRKKRDNESFHDYFLAIREMGRRARIEDDAIMTYVINGIEDDERNKIILYDAKNLEEFKLKLSSYASIAEKIRKKSKPGSNRFNKTRDRSQLNKGICYACGESGHLSRNCPKRKDGPKCFACNQFGHKSRECPQRSSVGVDKPRNAEVAWLGDKPTMPNTYMKAISINNVDVDALVDTGSDLSIIREDVYDLLGSPQLGESVSFRGVGSNSIQTKGSFYADVVIDGCLFQEVFHVVPVTVFPRKVILGKTLLSRSTLMIGPDFLKIMPVEGTSMLCLPTLREDKPDLDHITDQVQKDKLVSLIESYKPSKTKEPEFKMKILLKDETPIHQPPRRLSKFECDLAQKQIDEWLIEGIIRPSNSEFASPIVLVDKKDGSKRLCVDYRRLNKVVIRDHQPLPLIEEQIDRIGNMKVFSTLDLCNGFFHMPLDENSCKYTAFVTPFGQYEFTRAPFGLCVSPTQFQRFINKIFFPLIRQNKVLVYIDDIIALAGNEAQALEVLEEIFKVAADHGLNIKWGKCQFLKREINYLGYTIKNGKFQPCTDKIRAVVKFPTPKTFKAVQSFLGLAGYFRKFVKDFAVLARPLSDLLRKDQKFEFSAKQQEAFEKLKQALSSQPVLSIYDPRAPTEVHTDASRKGYGAVLLQRSKEDNLLHPVYYYSRKTSPAEEKYSSYHLEVLAVVMALQKFRVYLLGLSFTLITDCAAFRCTMEKKEVSPKIARWAIQLSEFDYKIVHRPGKQMKHVDALSRNPVSLMIESEGLLEEIKRAQHKDEACKAIFEILKQEEFEDYLVENDVLFKIKDGAQLLAVPRGLQSQIVRMAHEKGHFGSRKVESVLTADYYIPNLREKIDRCISSCIPCILAKKKTRPEGYLHSIPKEKIPLDTYHVDHLGPMTATKKGYRYIFAIVDAFTKFTWLYPTKTTTTDETIKKLTQQQSVFGNPGRIITDRGPAFTASNFKQYCKEQNIEHVMITTGVPRGNGQVERLHRIVIAVLTKLTIESEDAWYKHVGKVQQWLNSTLQRSIGTTPFKLLIGTDMKLKDDIELKTLIEKEMIQSFEEARDEARRNATEKIATVQAENQKTFNKRRRKPTTYEVGDIVAIKRTQFGTGLKLKPDYLGPYKITKVKHNERYDVEKVGHHEGPNVTSTAVDYLKPFTNFQTDDEEDEDIADERIDLDLSVNDEQERGSLPQNPF